MGEPAGSQVERTDPGPADKPLPDQPPKTIGKFEVRGEIGRGACGLVYRGFDPFVQRDVAIKVALADPKVPLQGDDQHSSFFTEARAAGMLQHPHIVSLYDAGMEGRLSYIVMEYVDGDTLLPACRKNGPRAPLDQVLDIIFKCAKGLDYAHSKGVLHRDIKPSNIMVTRDAVPKIMDFSIAEINANAAAKAGGGIIGSPLYMAPEQVRQQALGPQTDLYALGAVMYHLLVGEPPFPVSEMPLLFVQIKGQPAPRVSDKRPEIPRQVSEVVEKLLMKNPAERYASGGELATALSRVMEQLNFSGKQTTRRENRDSLRRLHFFNSFADAEIDEIMAASTMLPFEAGTTLIKEGEIDNAFYILAMGQAEVKKGGKRISLLDKGDCFGEIGFLTSAKRTADVVTASKGMALKVNASLMEKVSRDCQLRFYKVFTETLIYRLTVTSAKLSALSS